MTFVPILPTPFVPGISTLDDTHAPLLDLHPLADALTAEWPTDAHFVQYIVSQGDEVQQAPRINKPCLREIRDAGGEIWMPVFVVDLDTPNHVELASETDYTAFENDLVSHLSEEPLLQKFFAYYTTRAGARLVYVLKDPIPCDVGEVKHRDLIALFYKAGIKADVKCSDWTRLFRLPRVVRDRKMQGRRSFDQLQFQPEAVLDVRHIPSMPHVSPTRETSPAAAPLTDPLPEDTCWTELCESIDNRGRVRPSAWLVEAKRRLMNRKCFPILFEDQVIGQKGARDANLQVYVGEACALLVHQPKTTPEHIYALFLNQVVLLEPDAQTPDWRIPLWKAVCRYWPREVRRLEIEEENFKQRQEIKWGSVIEGVRAWCNAPELRISEENARAYIQRQAILASKNSYFLLRSDGRYDTTSVDKSHIIAKIRAVGMEELFPTQILDGKRVSDKAIQTMLNEFVTPGIEVDGVVDDRDGILTPDNRLLKRLFYRKEIEPVFNPKVDAWLRVFAGEEYERLCKWIGLALAWDEGPICALSIKGPPGCGKKLLVQGLVECVNTEECSDVTEFSRFKSGIMKSPFLVVNEGFPDPRHMPMSPSDTFRAFVSGDPIRIEEKFQAPITVRNPLRIIFTTNNDDIVRALAGGKDLTPYDREAISQRLYHVDVREDASRWLADVGGMEYTRGWIRGDAGSESSSTVAQHFMWLYTQRPRAKDTPNKRFLMEGCNNERLVKAMTLRSGAAPAVFEVLCQVVQVAGIDRLGAVIEGDKIFVTEHQIEEYDQIKNPSRRTLNAHTIKSVLASMRAPGTQPIKATKGGLKQQKRYAVWHELNTRLILDEAIERGLPCATLMRVVGLDKEVPSIAPSHKNGHVGAI